MLSTHSALVCARSKQTTVQSMSVYNYQVPSAAPSNMPMYGAALKIDCDIMHRVEGEYYCMYQGHHSVFT